MYLKRLRCGLWCYPGRYEYPYKTRCQEIFRRTLYRKFQPSKNVTGGYHYHTIEAESEEILDDIQNELAEKGFLAKLQDYEPVDFWGEEESNTNV